MSISSSSISPGIPDHPETARPDTEKLEVYEGLSIELTPAPFGKRFMAYCVDLGIVSCFFYLIALVGGIFFAGAFAGMAAFMKAFSIHNNWIGPIAGLAFFFLFFLAIASLVHGYFIYFEHKKGTTPGKALFGLKVVSLQSGPLTLGQCILRDLFRYLDCFLFFPGLLAVSITRRKQRIGDLAAGTLVVHSKSRESEANFLYIRAEDYAWLKDALAPTPVPKAEREKFLRFSYPEFVLQKTSSNPGIRNEWYRFALQYIQDPTSLQLDQESILRFFAEHCLQTSNQSV